ncbi:MAG TPA: twin-arginine translocase TatA/TatE family subunit [Planctomycetaceae bacterium]|nr:twin-arginine translocase TatA/TatE family subunit [Planctomycetaceae bacterium]
MFGLGTTELLIFMGVIVLLFGGARLPSLMRNLGRSANEFKAGLKEPVDDSAAKENIEEEEAKS